MKGGRKVVFFVETMLTYAIGWHWRNSKNKRSKVKVTGNENVKIAVCVSVTLTHLTHLSFTLCGKVHATL